ncbi:MAG: hypothetical protein GTO45_17650 [Candidatus Aminicenantes bacterium]|nr:hypothetical protein [Candidatus Aminicenantes bacterium]NIM80575.1 hypothetical protein [Candidatus Aminicenantes bacterium]NIN19956.1 hypothetical protein [Candidatus Aminicenantes bacterium]NIN43804.1 hypothetical protein [Candidatus Aminicenantes bacterium]NIN86582.1 hypothetical protein [Candidatus Aminicenantes bacterium]
MKQGILVAIIPVILAIISLIWNYFQQRLILKNKKESSKEIESIKTNLEKEKYIHQLKFDKEFEIYKGLWKEAAGLKLAVDDLFRFSEFVDPAKTSEERKKEKLTILIDRYNSFLETVEYNKPFYYQDIYEIADKILTFSYEGYSAEIILRDEQKKYEELEKRKAEIELLLDQLCKHIRDRIQI